MLTHFFMLTLVVPPHACSCSHLFMLKLFDAHICSCFLMVTLVHPHTWSCLHLFMLALFHGSGTFWRCCFGDDYSAQAIWHRDVLALNSFGARLFWRQCWDWQVRVMKMERKHGYDFILYCNCKRHLSNIQVAPVSQNVLWCLEFLFVF